MLLSGYACGALTASGAQTRVQLDFHPTPGCFKPRANFRWMSVRTRLYISYDMENDTSTAVLLVSSTTTPQHHKAAKSGENEMRFAKRNMRLL